MSDKEFLDNLENYLASLDNFVEHNIREKDLFIQVLRDMQKIGVPVRPILRKLRTKDKSQEYLDTIETLTICLTPYNKVLYVEDLKGGE